MGAPGQKAFERLGAVSERVAKPARPLLDRIFARLITPDGQARLEWAADADWARIQEEPLRARLLLRGAAVVVVLLLVWAGFAEIDEVTRGEAKVIPSSQVQIIQSVDGGVVEEMLVREGEIVDAGTLLLRIDPTRFVSSFAENRSQYFALRAKAARLEALTGGKPFQIPQEVAREVGAAGGEPAAELPFKHEPVGQALIHEQRRLKAHQIIAQAAIGIAGW